MTLLIKIKEAVDTTFGLDCYKTDRKRDKVNARKIYTAIACRLKSKNVHRKTLEQIGEVIGVDHSMVINYRDKAKTHIETEKSFSDKYLKCFRCFHLLTDLDNEL